MSDKQLRWLGSSRRDIREFKRLAGFQLRRVQQGLEPLDWKHVPTVGPGVREIRIHTALEHRVLSVRERRSKPMWSSPANGSELCSLTRAGHLTGG